jgi:hypothetical protein
LILCLISCLNCFTHYSFLHGTLKGYTYFIISIFRITIFSLVFYYFCMKASKLMKNKKYTLNTLKGIIVAGVLISSFTGAYIDFYIYNKMHGDGLQLCHTIFILLEESIDVIITLFYIFVIYQIQRSILKEDGQDAR